MCVLFFFQWMYKASPLPFHSTRPRLEHHHYHCSSSCMSLKFFISSSLSLVTNLSHFHFLFQFFSLIFFFLGFNFLNLLFSFSFQSFFLKNSSPHLSLLIFFLSVFAAFLQHWFSWFLFFMRFSSPSSLTCSLFFSYNTICATHFIFFLCKFFNDLHFFKSKVFHHNSPLFLDFFHCVQGEVHFFIVYHSLGATLLRASLALLVFYFSIWSLFYSLKKILLFFPSFTFCTHLVFFSKFCRCSGWHTQIFAPWDRLGFSSYFFSFSWNLLLGLESTFGIFCWVWISNSRNFEIFI